MKYFKLEYNYRRDTVEIIAYYEFLQLVMVRLTRPEWELQGCE